MLKNVTPSGLLLAVLGIGDDPTPPAPAQPVETLSFDDLFPADDGFNFQPTTALGNEPTPPAPAQPAPASPADDFFLRGGESVYKTREEAARGLEEKDTLIRQLRDIAIQATGIDPVTRKQVGIAPSGPQEPINYVQNRDRYFDDLQTAVLKGDKTAYMDAQQKLIMDTLSPIAPLIQDFAKSKAIESVAGEVSEFRTFYGSNDFRKVLEENPRLGQAISIAESNVALAGDLPDLYKLAYAYSQYKRIPELVRAANPTPQPAQNPSPVRPTTAPATLPPAIEDARVSATLATPEGRKAIIEKAKAQGLDKLVF